ncbi:hypothetical protein B4110_1537 [Parageobacillus toebii]|uniref:Uncharacterized protein n=1 Tax=Parageobacillus toebii TaxID=153151 RepID=A0A150MJP8_9BACL|nr:hypothetical protein B4110_1537 [Parageobacillus toebii]
MWDVFFALAILFEAAGAAMVKRSNGDEPRNPTIQSDQ